MKKIIFCFGVVSALISCESSSDEVVSAPLTYTTDIKPIIDGNCVVCHAPKGGPGSYYQLTSYTEVKAAIDNMIVRIEKPSSDPLKMPQGGSLSSSDIAKIKKWKTDGLKE